ncbi:MAG: hypothetical protein LBK58_03605, partial [Prevotellaceae bacterium]|nr:hypothetical protein [Prevotellaceae bacterium]
KAAGYKAARQAMALPQIRARRCLWIPGEDRPRRSGEQAEPTPKAAYPRPAAATSAVRTTR